MQSCKSCMYGWWNIIFGYKGYWSNYQTLLALIFSSIRYYFRTFWCIDYIHLPRRYENIFWAININYDCHRIHTHISLFVEVVAVTFLTLVVWWIAAVTASEIILANSSFWLAILFGTTSHKKCSCHRESTISFRRNGWPFQHTQEQINSYGRTGKHVFNCVQMLPWYLSDAVTVAIY